VFISFEWPKETNQRKGHPTIWSLRDSPALLVFIGAKINSLRSNKFLLNPMKPAMLGCTEGIKVKTSDSRICDAAQLHHPSLSTAGILRLSERCLSEASLANAQNTEERKEPRKARRGIRVPFLLVLFLLCPVGALGKQRK